MEDEIEWITAGTVADLLGKTYNAVALMRHKEVGPPFYLLDGGNRVRYRKDEVLAWRNRNRESAKTRREKKKEQQWIRKETKGWVEIPAEVKENKPPVNEIPTDGPKWVDEDGFIHYGEKPPEKAPSKDWRTVELEARNYQGRGVYPAWNAAPPRTAEENKAWHDNLIPDENDKFRTEGKPKAYAPPTYETKPKEEWDPGNAYGHGTKKKRKSKGAWSS